MKKANLRNTITYTEVECAMTALKNIETKMMQANLDGALYMENNVQEIYRKSKMPSGKDVEHIREAWYLLHELYMDEDEKKINI